MRKWMVVGAVLAAVIGGVLVTRPVRRRRPQWKRWLWLWLLAQGFQWWNPATWWNGIGHIASGAVQDIENWTRNAIHAAMSIYDGVLSYAVHAIEYAVSWTEGIASSAFNWAASALDWIYHSFGVVSSWIWLLVIGFWNDVIVPAINDVTNWANDIFRWAVDGFDAVRGAADWLYNNTILPLWHWIEAAEGWVQNHLAAFWDDLWKYWIGPIWKWVVWVADNVPQWIDFLIHTGWAAIMIVVKAWEWMVWFGENPIRGFHQLFDDVQRATDRSWVEAVSKGDVHLASQIEHDFSRVLGG